MPHKRMTDMEKKESIESVLKLDRLVFDKLEFTRLGFKNDKELGIEIQSSVSQKAETNIYKVTLIFKGNKPEEYTLEISLSGFFSIINDDDLDDKTKKALVTKNSVAILMPYLRSQVSLLTAQPDTECVVLPPFNINRMFGKKD